MIDFSLDFATIINNILDWFSFIITLTPGEAAWYLFLRGGWIVPLVIVIQLYLSWYADKKKSEFGSQIEYVLLAIEPPKNNDQVLTAVEKIFLSLTATWSKISDLDKYTTGKFNPPYSFEIVSLDSYIQFIVRVQKTYAEYVAALFYAQYPECRVYEIADYASRLPVDFNPETATHDCWATELVLSKNQFIPIKTYTQSGVNFNAKNPSVFDTPFANLLEVLSHLKRGEMIGVQIVATPTDDTWQDDGWKYLKELLGDKPKPKSTLTGEVVDFVSGMSWGLIQSAISSYNPGKAEAKKEEKKVEPKTNLDKNMLQGVENKISKPGYQAVVRLLYIARKEVFNKARGVVPLLGAIKQFSGLNSFKPGKKGSLNSSGWLKSTKEKKLAESKAKLVKRYKSRAAKSLDGAYILNVEELTSLFHLPISGIRAPMISRVAAKTSEPPNTLPVDLLEAEGLAVGDSTIQNDALSQPIKTVALKQADYAESVDNSKTTPAAKKTANSPEPEKQDQPPANLPFMVE